MAWSQIDLDAPETRRISVSAENQPRFFVYPVHSLSATSAMLLGLQFIKAYGTVCSRLPPKSTLYEHRGTLSLSLNLSKPTGYVMQQQLNIQQLYVLPTSYLFIYFIYYILSQLGWHPVVAVHHPLIPKQFP